MRSWLKRLTFAALGSPPATWWKLKQLASGGQLTILNFHRVAPNDNSSYPPLSPALFDDVVGFCRRHFELLTFGELSNYRAGQKPPLIISFDDGYQDFLTYSMPILRRHGVRCNHNVIPACVDSGMPPFNVTLQDYVGRAPATNLARLHVPGFGAVPAHEPRISLGTRLSAFVKNHQVADQKRIAAAVMPQIAELTDFAPTPMMTRSEVQAVAEVHELGAHSFEHATMALESAAYIKRDAAACQAWFTRLLGRPTDIYALPNGSGSAEQIAIIRAAGFRHVLRVEDDYSSLGATDHPRFTMDGQSRAEARFRATGFRRR
jgi:peptidoglycan/xylan/chitin deacetylase (PgdA/CDA1 family)